MKMDTAKRLQEQARLQGLELTREQADELVPVVESFISAVAENAPVLPFDVDATAFHAALHAFKDDWNAS